MPTGPERRWRFPCRERSPNDEWRSDERSLRMLRVPEDG
jgi:hypothetical protein